MIGAGKVTQAMVDQNNALIDANKKLQEQQLKLQEEAGSQQSEMYDWQMKQLEGEQTINEKNDKARDAAYAKNDADETKGELYQDKADAKSDRDTARADNRSNDQLLKNDIRENAANDQANKTYYQDQVIPLLRELKKYTDLAGFQLDRYFKKFDLQDIIAKMQAKIEEGNKWGEILRGALAAFAKMSDAIAGTRSSSAQSMLSFNNYLQVLPLSEMADLSTYLQTAEHAKGLEEDLALKQKTYEEKVADPYTADKVKESKAELAKTTAELAAAEEKLATAKENETAAKDAAKLARDDQRTAEKKVREAEKDVNEIKAKLAKMEQDSQEHKMAQQRVKAEIDKNDNERSKIDMQSRV